MSAYYTGSPVYLTAVLLLIQTGCEVALPHLIKRHRLEELGTLQSRASALDDDDDDEDEDEEAEN